MLPTEKDIEKSLNNLAITDESFAQAQAKCVAKKENLKIKKLALLGTTGTQMEKEKVALEHPHYKKAVDEYSDAIYKKTLLEAKRVRWNLIIEVWRSLNANMRKS